MAEDTTSVQGEKTPHDIKEHVIEQRKASMRYWNQNFYTEWAEIYRNLNARTKAFRSYNYKSGEWEEDKSGRTNVCVPDHFVMWRRGTARLTRNPPNLRVRGGPDTDQGQINRDKVSAKLMFNWDRAESQRAFKKVVSEAYAFGWSVGKTWYDEVPVVRVLRRLTNTLTPQDFKNLANAKDPKVADLMKRFGPRLQDQTPFTDAEQAEMVSSMGDEAKLQVSTVRYKGPLLDHVFSGDVFPEPGFRSLPQSGYVIECSQRDEEWLDYWKNQTTINPETGEESKVFADEKACQEVLDQAGQRVYIDEQELSLRRRMRDEIEVANPITAGRPIRAPKKRFLVDERHTIVNGHLCVDFVAEETVYLGRLWYPWETYGRFTYCEMVLIPDLLGGIGQSTLRVTRFLQQLRNARMNQTTDFINNKLLPIVLQRRTGDQTQYDMIRTDWMRVVQVDDLNEFKNFDDPSFPGEAWTDQQQLQQQMQSSDPATSDFTPGSTTNPLAGKLATTAALQAKAADSVTADTLDNMNMFIRDVVELQLWMDQQAMDEPVDVPRQYFERVDALSMRTQGQNVRTIKVSPMDIQEDYEILPEAGSTLASDDQFRIGSLQQFYAIASQHPDIMNLRNILTKLAQATPGINAEEVIIPEQPQPQQGPEIRIVVSVPAPWEKLAPDVKATILERAGLPTEMTHATGVGEMLDHVRRAADNAAELERPSDYEMPQPSGGGPNGNTGQKRTANGVGANRTSGNAPKR